MNFSEFKSKRYAEKLFLFLLLSIVIGYLISPKIIFRPTIYKVGAMVSGSQWILNQDGKAISHDFGKVDIGFSYERRISGMVWGAVGVGYSGFGNLQVRSDSDVDYESDIAGSPFLNFSINFRPE